MTRIKQILVDGQGWIYAEKQVDGQGSAMGTYTIESNPIDEISKNGEMASVPWYKQGEKEYNGKYVVVIEYYKD